MDILVDSGEKLLAKKGVDDSQTTAGFLYVSGINRPTSSDKMVQTLTSGAFPKINESKFEKSEPSSENGPYEGPDQKPIEVKLV